VNQSLSFEPDFVRCASPSRGRCFTRRAVVAAVAALLTGLLAACGGGGGGAASAMSANASLGGPDGAALQPVVQPASDPKAVVQTRAFTAAPWMSYYGGASSMGSLATAAATFRVMDVDLDPDAGNFQPADVAALKNGGRNLVLSYLNLGSCENFRSYWTSVPAGFVSCAANTAAQAGAYSGYRQEVWMNLSNPDYQHLIVDYVAPRLVAQGADGFYLDNLEIVEHGASTTDGPCDATCAQGGLDLVRKLREKYPTLVFVMQNATGKVTRQGVTGGVAFASLLDGVAHEEVYAPAYDASAEAELLAWKRLGLTPNGHPFWIATLDYVGGCNAGGSAQTVFARSRNKGFVPYASDRSSGQNVVCYWGL
jgi:cysteinyl-tRNA synthetase